MPGFPTRRKFISTTTKVAALSSLLPIMGTRLHAANLVSADAEASTGRKVKHSACKWCYGSIPLEDLCIAGKEFGLNSVELLNPSDLPTLKKHGMTCAIATNPVVKAADGNKVGGIGRGWNNTKYHDVLIPAFETQIKDAAAVGMDNVICFSGNRRGMDDEVGMKNCAQGIKKLMPLCEKLGVKLSMELLNSKKDHRDYMCDRTEWGVDLCRLVGSENFKLLYDIYHMQIMEGDVIATIKKHHTFISHYHTGGVPGRGEIDDTQELYYPAIIKAILETGYEGFVGQEFIPRREDKLASLKQGVTICNV